MSKLKHHLDHLKEQHRKLDEQIRREHQNHADEQSIKKHKLEKLALKQEIDKLERQSQ